MDPIVQMFSNRLAKVFKHRSKLARRQNIQCYRLYDRDLTEYPVSIDLYGDKAYVSIYAKKSAEADIEDQWPQEKINACFAVISQITGVAPGEIYLKQRSKMSHRTAGAQYEKVDAEGHFFSVEEGGLKFRVNLTDYLDTGLFLDHRTTRQMVREVAKGKNVLNLFCYTGSFSVYAAHGAAARVCSVDLSKTYLNWAEENFKYNRLLTPSSKNKYTFVAADVKAYLKTLEPNSFDLVVMDPPTFSNSKKMKDILDIQRDHVEMIGDVLKGLTPGGQLFFSTNFTRFVLDKENIPAHKITDITKRTTPFDFEGKLKRWCYLIEK